MSLTKIIDMILQVVFLGFGNKLKGYRTIIVNVVAMATGAYEWFMGSGLLSYLCETFNVGCNATDSSFFGIIIVIYGALQTALRLVTDSPVGSSVPKAVG